MRPRDSRPRSRTLALQAFEFRATLPGDSLLRVDVMDRNTFTSDSLIGGTEIDIEDRIFSRRWKQQCKARPPVERRELRRPEWNLRQGVLDLFVEILTEDEALSRRMLDISPPPAQKWELRLIVWSAKDVPLDLDDSGLSDLYVSAQYASTRHAAERPTSHTAHLDARAGTTTRGQRRRSVARFIAPTRTFARRKARRHGIGA